MASIFVFYLFSIKIFGKKTAIIASALFSFSTIFFFMGFRVYSEILTVFLILLASYLFVEKFHYWAGIFFGLAFLAKFPAPLFLVAAGAVLLWKREIKNAAYLGLGFATPVIPFLILNQIFYGNFLLPLIQGSKVIKEVVGCNVLRYKPFYHYLYLIIADNFLNAFSLLGIFLFFRKFRKNEKMIYPLLCLVLPLAYFMQLHCRDHRYLILFIPFVILYSAFGISFLIRKRNYFAPVVILILVLSVVISARFFEQSRQPFNPAADEYFKFMSGKNSSLEIWSGDPTVSVYTDQKVNKIYYPIYDGSYAMLFFEYMVLNEDNIGYVLLDNCGGGMMCPPDDSKCERQLNLTYGFLSENFDLVYNSTYGICNYMVYEKR
jgi:4-amino-4-deoxy-L-arabinose transferase-like glycosyltransferase